MTLALSVALALSAKASAAPPPCAKLSAKAKPPTRVARSEADWAHWDPKLAEALRSLWQRSVLALGRNTAHATLDRTGPSRRRPAAVGPFEALAWDLAEGTFVAFRVPVVPADETDNAKTRMERFAGYWSGGKLLRLDDRCLAGIDPSHVDETARSVFGRPNEGDCVTVQCDLPAKPR
jgi:hypothetical protein